MDKPKNPYLVFLQQFVNERFHNDTLVNIGDVTITLAYPDIEISDREGTMVINCHKAGFHVEPDFYPLMRFLVRYPEFFEGIVCSCVELDMLYFDWLN